MQKKIGLGDIAFVVFSLVFLVGITTFFAPCGPKEDGSWMNCHWAGNALIGLSAVLVVLSLVHIFVPAQVKIGIDSAAFLIAVLAIVLPGNLIKLCGMHTMKCHTLTRPATIIVSAFIILSVALDIFLQTKKRKD